MPLKIFLITLYHKSYILLNIVNGDLFLIFFFVIVFIDYKHLTLIYCA